MLHFSSQTGSLIALAKGITDFVAPETVPEGLLQFSPIRLILLMLDMPVHVLRAPCGIILPKNWAHD